MTGWIPRSTHARTNTTTRVHTHTLTHTHYLTHTRSLARARTNARTHSLTHKNTQRTHNAHTTTQHTQTHPHNTNTNTNTNANANTNTNIHAHAHAHAHEPTCKSHREQGTRTNLQESQRTRHTNQPAGVTENKAPTILTHLAHPPRPVIYGPSRRLRLRRRASCAARAGGAGEGVLASVAQQGRCGSALCLRLLSIIHSIKQQLG